MTQTLYNLRSGLPLRVVSHGDIRIELAPGRTVRVDSDGEVIYRVHDGTANLVIGDPNEHWIIQTLHSLGLGAFLRDRVSAASARRGGVSVVKLPLGTAVTMVCSDRIYIDEATMRALDYLESTR